MITSEVFTRTVQIRCTEYATGCLIDSNDSRFLLTAEHVVRDFPEKDIDIRRGGEWEPLTSGLELIHRETKLDIAVFRVLGEPTPKNSAPYYGSEGIIWGQDIYICGFPRVDDQVLPDSNVPTAHVRKGILSAMETNDYKPDIVWLVDVLIESGYSGGPAVIVNADGRRQVIGMVKSIKSTSDKYAVEDADMKEVEGLFYRRQSGIVEVVDLACLKNLGIL